MGRTFPLSRSNSLPLQSLRAESAHSDVIWSVTQAVQLSEFESTGDIRRTGLLLATGQCRAKNVPSMWGSENRG